MVSMTWNYRIIKRTCPETGEVYYALNEVFYRESGEPMAFSDGDEVVGSSPEEIIQVLEMMLKDAKKDQPIVEEGDFNKVKPDYELDDGQLTEEQYNLIQKESNKTKYSHDEMIDRMLQNPKVLEEYNQIKEHGHTIKDSIDQIVIDLHNIARRVENNGNMYGVGYSIREVADRLSEYKKKDWHLEYVPDSESWYEP